MLTPNSNKTTNPFFQGAIPKLIYRNAIKAIPDDPHFRLSFLEVFDAFEGTEEIKQEVLDGVLKDFGDDPRYVTFYAKHKLAEGVPIQGKLNPSSVLLSVPHSLHADQPEEVLFAIQAFESALNTKLSAKLWEQYLQFCVDCLKDTAREKHSSAVLSNFPLCTSLNLPHLV